MESPLKLAILVTLACCALAYEEPFTEKYSWKVPDFVYPTEAARQAAIKSGEYVPENNLPLGVERWMNKLFVSFPRWKNGVAATLTYIDLKNTEKSPKFTPYPNWDAHKIHSGTGKGKIVNMFRMNVDVCDRLWLHDLGTDDILGSMRTGNVTTIKEANIQIYDLKSDKLIKEYTIPKKLFKPDSWLVNILVETSKDDCSKAYAYLSDLQQLIVYSLHDDDSWTVNHPFFHFDPLNVDYNSDGINYQRSDGLFGLALSPMKSDGYSTLYLHPQSGTHEFSVSTQVLRNKGLHVPGFEREREFYHLVKIVGDRGPSTQSTAETLDPKTGALFNTLINLNAIGCYNIFNRKPLDKFTGAILGQNNVTMIFPNDIKVDKEGMLWFTTNRLPKFMYSKMNFNEVNYRVMTGVVQKIIKGTACDKLLTKLPMSQNSSSRLVAANSILSVVVMLALSSVYTWLKIDAASLVSSDVYKRATRL